MLRKLFTSLLVGLSLIGLVGCGEAPIDVNDVKVTYQEVTEIADEDLENSERISQMMLEEFNVEYKVELQFTEEEKKTPEFKEYSTMSLSDIEGMDKEQLKQADLVLNKVLELGTNEDIEVEEIKYSAETRQTMVTLYSELISAMQETSNIVNELDQYKMHPEEFIDSPVGFDTVYNTLNQMNAKLTEVAETVTIFNENLKFDDEIAIDFCSLQKAFDKFANQYPNEIYPREKDSIELQQARNEINRIWEKHMMTDIRQLEGVAAPTK